MLFDIATSDAESLIENDPKRTHDDVAEDLCFLMDQRSGRMMYLGENNTRYQNFVPYVFKRLTVLLHLCLSVLLFLSPLLPFLLPLLLFPALRLV